MKRLLLILVVFIPMFGMREAVADVVPDNIEYAALVDLYNSTNGASWTNKTNWLNGTTSVNFATWYGVTVVNGDVRHISLSGNNLVGNLPSSIGELTALQSLTLSNNSLSGALPTELGNLSSLGTLSLSNNQFSGSIPITLIQPSLITLGLNNNNLSGPIPSSVGSLTNLFFLYLNHNNFSGSIPVELGNLSNLNLLYLSNNQLNGSIPPQLGNLTGLTQLTIENNLLTGTIPPQLGNLSNLTSLYLSNNQLSGAVPTEIGSMPSLTQLLLIQNQFTSLPSSIASSSSLQSLFVALNKLGFDSVEPLFPTPGNNTVNNFSFTPQIDFGAVESIRWTAGVANSYTPPVVPGGVHNLYQWQKDVSGTFTDISGQTSSTFSLNPPLPANAGTYRLKVTNSYVTGHVLYSAPITLSIEIGNVPDIDEYNALVEFYNSTGGPSWTNNSNWLNGTTSADFATWFGVTVTNGDVSAIMLPSNNLSGTLPASMGTLRRLTNIQLPSNNLSGSLGSWVGQLNSLQFLTLGVNNFSGTLPNELASLTSLQYIDVASNSFTGSLPAFVGPYGLQHLNVQANQLSGHIPGSIGSIISLGYLDLKFNDFTIADMIDVAQAWDAVPSHFANNLQLYWQRTSDSQTTDTAVEGTNLTLSAQIEAGSTPPNEYRWFKIQNEAYYDYYQNIMYDGGVPISPLNVVTPQDNGQQLSFNSLTLADGGLYIYTVTNPVLPRFGHVSSQHFVFVEPDPTPQIIYVRKGATAPGNGTSWATAYPDLQQALSAAAGTSGNKEIWVARGEYRPTTTIDKTISFVIPEKTVLYGGFIGNEPALEQRNWRENRTVLSGDLGLQFDKTDNSYHVVVVRDVAIAGIDGFIIKHGNADISGGGGSTFDQQGGGLLVLASTKPTQPKISNCEFLENSGQYGGGVGILSFGFPASAEISNTFFNGNGALDGGAISINSMVGQSPLLVNCSFALNKASGSGGAIVNVAGDAKVINSTFCKNSSNNSGGAIYSFPTNSPFMSVENSILWKNYVGPSENNSVFNQVANGNLVNVKNSIVQGGFGSSADNNIDADPLFVKEPISTGVYPRTSVIPVANTDPKYEDVMAFSGPKLGNTQTYGVLNDHEFGKLYLVGAQLQVIDFNNLTNGLPTSTLYPQLNWGRIQNMDRSIHQSSNRIFLGTDYGGVMSINRINGSFSNLNILAGEPISPLWVTAEDIVVDNANELLYSPIFYRNTAVRSPKEFYGIVELNLQTNTKRWISGSSVPVSIPPVNGAGDDLYWNGHRLLLDDISNTLYFSMGNGVWWWNRTTNETGVYNTLGGMQLQPGNPNLPSNLTTGMFIDHNQNKFYIGTHAGLFVWDRNSNTSLVYNKDNSVLTDNLINIIDKDDNNIIYVSCELAGVFSINTITGEQKLFRKDVGETHPQMVDTETESVNYDNVDQKLYIGTNYPNGGVWIRDFGNLVPDYGDLRLDRYSPAIDVANGSIFPPTILVDITGLPRFIDYPLLSGTQDLDLGAYEREFLCYAINASFSYDSESSLYTFTPILDQTLTGCSISYSWDFGDGTSSTEPAPSHTFSMHGTYTVTLNVDYGCSDCPDSQASVQNIIVNEVVCTSFYCNPDGSISVGTPGQALGYKLSVQGKVIAEGARVALKDRWPDFVFEKKYSLIPLPELKRFVEVNNHLPEMPSAQQVRSEGIDAEQMSIKLMQKVEELTLYTIQLFDRVEKLKEP